jgi:hypothetical protein
MDLKFKHRTCFGQGRARRDEGRVENDETTVCTSKNRLGVGQSARRRGFRLERQVGMISTTAQVSFGVSSCEKEKEEACTSTDHLPNKEGHSLVEASAFGSPNRRRRYHALIVAVVEDFLPRCQLILFSDWGSPDISIF